MPYLQGAWVAFKHIPQDELVKKTGIPYSSLSKWKSTRIERVRLLEISVLLQYQTEAKRNITLNDHQLDLTNLLLNLGGTEIKPKDLFVLLGESPRTIYSWWNAQGDKKRKQLLMLIEGLFCILALCQYSKMKNLNIASDSEQAASLLCQFDEQLIERIAFRAFVKL